MTKERVLTEAQEKALLIVREHGPILPARFSELMWPDSPAHNRAHNVGSSGAARGVALWRSAGGFLGKLRRRGWVRAKYSRVDPLHRLGYILTAEGHEILKQAGVA